MNFTVIIYIYSLSALCILLICYRICFFVLHPAFHYLKCFTFRFLLLPLLIQSKQFVMLTRFQTLLILFYFGINVTVICMKDESIGTNTALMTIINLIPTSLGHRINPFADFLGISLRSYSLVHRWTGRVAAVHAVIHTVLMLTRAQHSTSQLASGSLVCLAMLYQ